MKFRCFKQISNNGKPERRLSLGEYNRAVSWSKYLVSSGAEIKGEGEEEWSADMSQLFIGNKFATGRHSRIYRGIYKQQDVAIKLVSQPEEDESLASMLEKQFTSEVALLFRLRHPNIITFVAACKKPPVFCIITEYLAGGSLRKYLHQQQPHSVPHYLVLKLALDIARGMQYLHAEGILHRDLKSENLLLGEDMCVKVADFGISCLESQCGSAKGFTGTYRWMAPEMIKEKQHTKKVDVYGFGIVLWELLTALIPFDDMTPEQAAFAVCQKGLGPDYTTISAAMRSRSTPVSYEELYEKLLDHELFLQHEESKKSPQIVAAVAQTGNPRKPSNNTNHNWRPSSRGGYNPNWRQQRNWNSQTPEKPKCQLCDRIGHTAKVCRSQSHSHHQARAHYANSNPQQQSPWDCC
ncbi:hypothetical protein K2173_022828 [Erythroxylum novogranatense]|uniref:non-specific serine/threonine protein kinase n=1 Tax=Erythroxylum novogranatense TaxID=1862640 RepID=A0AAV8SMS4_9ROSI|nr:hypothetical protein K2173_022828 [Erythroxylum novogranatense]